METTLKAKRWVFDAVFPLFKASQDAIVINLSSIAGMGAPYLRVNELMLGIFETRHAQSIL